MENNPDGKDSGSFIKWIQKSGSIPQPSAELS